MYLALFYSHIKAEAQSHLLLAPATAWLRKA